MAKLTDEEKALRKAATSLRNKAHGVRVREFRARTDEAVAVVHARNAPHIEHAERRSEEAMKAHQELLADFDRRIAELKEQRDAALKEGQEAYAPLRKARSDAYDRRRAEEKEAQDAVLERYPDLKGDALYTAPCWKEIDEFMDEARIQIGKA